MDAEYSTLFNLLRATAADLTPRLIPLSLKMLGVLSLITGAWLVIKGALANSVQEIFSSLLGLLVQASLILMILTTWQPLAVNVVMNTSDDISQALAGSGNPSDGLIRAVNTSGKNTLKMILAGPPAREVDRTQTEGEKGWFSSVLSSVSEAGQDLWNAFASLPAMLLMLGLGVFYLLSGGVLIMLSIGVQIVSEVMLAIAAIIGPILLAWSIFPPTSFLRESLLRYSFYAVIYKAVAVIIALLLTSASSVLLGGIEAGEAFSFMSILTMMALTGVMIFIVIQANAIAQGLTSGTGASGPGQIVQRAFMPGKVGGGGSAPGK
jgi:hypothetical protein